MPISLLLWIAMMRVSSRHEPTIEGSEADANDACDSARPAQDEYG
jgi:hypothetical protein